MNQINEKQSASLNSFLKIRQIPEIHQKVDNSTQSQPRGSSSTLFNETFRLENFSFFTAI